MAVQKTSSVEKQGEVDREAPGQVPGTTSDPQLEAALYLESMAAELTTLARRARLEALAYFFEMARVEASIQIEARAETENGKC